MLNRKLNRENQRVRWWHKMVTSLGDWFSSVPFGYWRHPLYVFFSDVKHLSYCPKNIYRDGSVDKRSYDP